MTNLRNYISNGQRFCNTSELERLTEDFPVERIIPGKFYQLLKERMLKDSYGMVAFRNSPADNQAVEIIFGQLAAEAVRQNMWVGYDTNWQSRKIKYVEKNMENPGAVGDEAIGIIRARNAGLLHLEIVGDSLHGDKVYAVPTEKFIKFVQKRLPGYWPCQETVHRISHYLFEIPEKIRRLYSTIRTIGSGTHA